MKGGEIVGLFSRFKNANTTDAFKMVTETSNGFYLWDGKMYQSDIIRACIKPKVKAIGKAVAKHIRETRTRNGTNIQINPEPYIRFLLEEPNPYMSGQMMQEKVANQLALNNNAFILIVRDDFGYPCQLWPIPCSTVETTYVGNELYLKFTFNNGKYNTFPYTEIIHLRDDFNENELFGESPVDALKDTMNCIKTIDQGLVKAIKNSGVIRWLLKYSSQLRPEDLKRNVKEFADNYLSVESDTFGVAGTDAKAEAQRIEPKDYVPNALFAKSEIERIYSFFNTNENIVKSSFTEDQWIAYYEIAVEPTIQQMSAEYTRKLFTRRERGFGNSIVFESSNLTFAGMSTKLALQAMVDRGAMTPNEWRRILNLAPLEGGDTPIRRLDTAPTTEYDSKSGDDKKEGGAESENN